MSVIIDQLLALLEDALAHNDVLEGQVHDLELALHLDATANVQAAFGVSESLAQLLIVLADGKPRSKEQLLSALFYRRPDVDAPDLKILDTLTCKLRKLVKPRGVEITTVWGSGYRLTAGLDVVRAAIEQDRAEQARLRKLERAREHYKRQRIAQKRKDRKAYEEQSISRQKPWLADGISRTTWYERRRTGFLPTNDNALVRRADAPNRSAA